MTDFSIDHIKGKSLADIEGFGQTTKQGTHYKLSGEGALVILIHGIGGYSFIFEPLERELQQNYKVLRYDLIGRGFSERGVNYTLVEHLEQLEVLLKELNLKDEPCFLIAHSMGGVIASAFTAAHSKQVKGCVLLSPAGAMDNPIPAFGFIQSLVNSCACCCIPLFTNLVFSGPPPVHEDIATTANNDGRDILTKEELEVGDKLAPWVLEHCVASVRRNTATSLAASVARIPLTSLFNPRNRNSGIGRFISESDVDAAGLKARAIPVFIIIGAQDRSCRGIRVAPYKAVFGEENVTSQPTPGRHCFFVQSPQPTYGYINEFLSKWSK
jgi:pimeloyl-ACP methyl ester carboxylesterase